MLKFQCAFQHKEKIQRVLFTTRFTRKARKGTHHFNLGLQAAPEKFTEKGSMDWLDQLSVTSDVGLRLRR